MKYLFILLISSLPVFSLAQQVVDTVETPSGKMLIFADRSWKMLVESDLDEAVLDDSHFDGILNENVHNYIANESGLNFVQTWDNEICFTSNRSNDLSKLQDTIWLCVDGDLSNKFVTPNAGIITSRYGYRKGRYHNGIDIAFNVTDTIRAAWSGKVRYSKYNNGGYGNLVVIRHENGLETFYAHLSRLLVDPNQDVQAGDVIGIGGNTGRSFGPHLHFEVRFYDAPINPEEMIDFASSQIKDPNLFVHKGLFRPGAKPSDYYETHNHSSDVAAVARPNVASKRYYKVRSGDTLSKIAARHNMTIAQLCKVNGIRQNATLQIGRSLRTK
jgi:LysM repeat protein